MSSIPWKQIASLVHKNKVVTPIEIQKKKKKAPVSRKVASTLKCQQYHKDIGYTTGQCLIGKNNLGVSISVLKPLTDKIWPKLHVKAMVALSGILKHHVFEDFSVVVVLPNSCIRIMCWKHFGWLSVTFFILVAAMKMDTMTSICIFSGDYFQYFC
jgi:hypothetical protein